MGIIISIGWVLQDCQSNTRGYEKEEKIRDRTPHQQMIRAGDA